MPRKHSIVGKIDRPKARRSMLRKELEAVTLALAEEEKKLEQLPNVIEKMKEDMKVLVREAIRLYKSIKPIPGSVEDDQKEIDEVDQICLCAIQAIQSFLGSM
jgi:archaellum component FlaC